MTKNSVNQSYFIVKPSKTLRSRAYFVIATALISLIGVIDYRTKNSTDFGIYEFNIYVLLMFLTIIYFVNQLICSFYVLDSIITYRVAGIKILSVQLSKILYSRSKFMKSMFYKDEVLVIQIFFVFITISDLWENFSMLKSKVLSHLEQSK